MASLHHVGRRTRTAPPATKKKPGAKESALEPAPAANALDVILVGGGPTSLTGYAAALRHLETRGVVRVAALVGIPDPAGAALGSGFPQARLAASLEALVIAPGAVVLLASSPHLHPAQAGAALRRGWHVASVSPLARSTRDAAAIAAVAKRNERLLATAFPRRFSSAVHYLRTLCRDQLIGPLVSVELHDGAPPSPGANDAGDGILTDVGVYAFDFLTWCVGAPTITAYADDAMGGVEANAYVEAALPEGVRATLHLSHDWPTSRCYEFVFERGVVRWRADEANRLTIQLASAPATLDAQLGPMFAPARASERPPPASDVAHIIAQVENIIAGITRPELLQVSLADAQAALALVEYCHAHRTLLEQPWLSRNELAHARSLSTPTELPRA